MTEFILAKTVTKIVVEIDSNTIKKIEKGRRVLLDVVCVGSNIKDLEVEIYSSDAYEEENEEEIDV